MKRLARIISSLFSHKHNYIFVSNEPGPQGWWWEYEKCKCGAEIKFLVAGPRG